MKSIVMGIAIAMFFLAGPVSATKWITEQPNNHPNQNETEVHGVLGYGAFGAGFRVGIPMVPQGFVPTINNNVAINFGADLLDWPAPDYQVAGLFIPVMLQWNFYLTREWSVFGEGGVASQIWFSRRSSGSSEQFFIWPGISVGAKYYFTPGKYPALVMRMGYPSGFTIGVSF